MCRDRVEEAWAGHVRWADIAIRSAKVEQVATLVKRPADDGLEKMPDWTPRVARTGFAGLDASCTKRRSTTWAAPVAVARVPRRELIDRNRA